MVICKHLQQLLAQLAMALLAGQPETRSRQGLQELRAGLTTGDPVRFYNISPSSSVTEGFTSSKTEVIVEKQIKALLASLIWFLTHLSFTKS